MNIDIHSHILPGIDDGSKNIEMTIEMLRVAEESGTGAIVATPHYCNGYGEATLSEVKVLVGKLKEEATKEGINIEIYAGQEVFYTEGILRMYKDGLIGTINDTRYMLIEFSMREFEEGIFDILYELKLMGIVPIIAHPERYLPIINNLAKINDFIEEGYLFQMDAGSITGQFGKNVQKVTEKFLENNIYSFIGSDAHNTGKRSTDMISSALTHEKINKNVAEQFRVNSQRMLENGQVEFIGNVIKVKKKLFSFLK